jgi:hypothetical protein
VIASHRLPPNETTYDFGFYCMGTRGNYEDVGFGTPLFILSVFHTGLLFIIALFFLLLAALRQRGRRGLPCALGHPREESVRRVGG